MTDKIVTQVVNTNYLKVGRIQDAGWPDHDDNDDDGDDDVASFQLTSRSINSHGHGY